MLFSPSATSTRAVALESITFRAEPFQLTSDGYFSPNDPRTRIALFCMDLELSGRRRPNALTADAQDGAGKILSVEGRICRQVPPTINVLTGDIITDFRGV